MTLTYRNAASDEGHAAMKKPAKKGTCPVCKGVRWVCEDDHDKPFDSKDCSVGVPCVCNPSEGHPRIVETN